MIRAGAGISGARGSREAAEGAVGDAMDMAGIGRADLVFLFVTSEHLEDWPRIARAAREHLDPDEYLRRADAHRFFEPLGDAVVTGPTGHNVRDVRVLVAW